ncbi:desiccation protectant protein Lea14 homolog [Argentina anserina]|uniref:desiccation protectant protein Lea14 homolog n=1 Tax=Argentina anserina TaxID=57926 RepID=UPI0021768836|nr:desiccation protectant protein Lea14 homolog [Potentilla anserina]
MSLCSLSTVKLLRSLYLKVWEFLGIAKNYIVTKVRGYVLTRIVEMQRRSALIVDLQLENIYFDSIDLLFKISVYNSFWFSMPVSQASFKMKISGSEPILGKLKEPVYMKAGAESILFVLAKVPFSMPIKLANDISVDANIDYRVDLRLTVHLPIIGNISLPLPCQQGEAKISELFSNLMDQILKSW